jgi:hypothetical protein
MRAPNLLVPVLGGAAWEHRERAALRKIMGEIKEIEAAAAPRDG